MKIALLSPGAGVHYDVTDIYTEIIAGMKKRGQLEGVEIDIVGDFPLDTPGIIDEEYVTHIALNLVKRIKKLCEGDKKYDAIICTGAYDVGFYACRLVSNIPITFALHSAVHFASLIGERCSIIQSQPPGCTIHRHNVQRYGFNDKVVSVRAHNKHLSLAEKTKMGELRRKYKTKEERLKDPWYQKRIKEEIDEVVSQCIAAIEEDRADSIIILEGPMHCFQYELRQRLDEAGYSEIPIIWGMDTALEMAKAMVNLKLMQAPRAYPSEALKAKPKYW